MNVLLGRVPSRQQIVIDFRVAAERYLTSSFPRAPPSKAPLSFTVSSEPSPTLKQPLFQPLATPAGNKQPRSSLQGLLWRQYKFCTSWTLPISFAEPLSFFFFRFNTLEKILEKYSQTRPDVWRVFGDFLALDVLPSFAGNRFETFGERRFRCLTVKISTGRYYRSMREILILLTNGWFSGLKGFIQIRADKPKLIDPGGNILQT